MTREEAIARLEANRGAFVFKETNEALDMAIEALSDMPIHFGYCKDCMSYNGDGAKCKWGLLTGESGYCQHFGERTDEPQLTSAEPKHELPEYVEWKGAFEALSEPSIVRCVECKHNWNTARNHGVMNPRCDFTKKVLSENDFCSFGERREP